MAKRSHTEFARDDGNVVQHSPNKFAKRPQNSDALAVILQHSDNLIDCLQKLKNGAEPTSTSSIERLEALSITLLPAFQVLSGKAPSVQVGETFTSDKRNEPQTSGFPDATSSHQPVASRALIPPVGPLTAWTLSDIPAGYPPLPPISDPALEETALTHSGMRNSKTDPGYEDLEFLGDAFIYHVSSEIITQTFPRMHHGRRSQMRERLLRNATLGEHSRYYGLFNKARFPAEYSEGGNNSGNTATKQQKEKAMGDVFESYVGALVRADSQGVTKALNWLKPLWAMSVAKEIRAEYRQGQDGNQQQAEHPKQALAKRIGCPPVIIKYVETDNKPRTDPKTKLPLFSMSLRVDAWGKSEVLATASALSKKDAGAEAAKIALNNKKKLRFYEDKKRAYVEAQEAQITDGV